MGQKKIPHIANTVESLIRSINAKIKQAIMGAGVLRILLCRLSDRSYTQPNI